MNRIVIFLVVLVLGCVVFPGCSASYVPRQSKKPIKPDALLEFSSTNPVEIFNGQECNEDTQLGILGWGSQYKGNLRLWTETAIGYVRRECEQRDIAVTAEADKKLTMAITEAAMTQPGGLAVRCTVTLEVETGSGYKQAYEVSRQSSTATDPRERPTRRFRTRLSPC